MDGHLSDPDEWDGTSITIGLRGRLGPRAAATLPEHVLEALRPDTRRVVVDVSGVTDCVGGVPAALVQVEAALIDDACLLEVVGAPPRLEAVLTAAGLGGDGAQSATRADLATIDRLLQGADGRAERVAAADRAVRRLAGPEMGNVQTLDAADGDLRIAAHHGFAEPFLTYFARVGDDSTACGTALGRSDLVVVEDVATSPIFAGTGGLDVMLEAGALAVESMPYFTPAGRPAGVMSMHHPTAGPRPKRELMVLRLVAARLGALW